MPVGIYEGRRSVSHGKHFEDGSIEYWRKHLNAEIIRIDRLPELMDVYCSKSKHYDAVTKGWKRKKSVNEVNIVIGDGCLWQYSGHEKQPLPNASCGAYPIQACDILISMYGKDVARKFCCNGRIDKLILKKWGQKTHIEKLIDKSMRKNK